MQEPALARVPRHFKRIKDGPCIIHASSKDIHGVTKAKYEAEQNLA
jgi:hypothetical protein